MAAVERYYLIYQEVTDEECLLTIQPYDEEDQLADAINRLEGAGNHDYTIIRGHKMKARLRITVDLSEWEDPGDPPDAPAS